jgi:hypothetical protein
MTKTQTSRGNVVDIFPTAWQAAAVGRAIEQKYNLPFRVEKGMGGHTLLVNDDDGWVDDHVEMLSSMCLAVKYVEQDVHLLRLADGGLVGAYHSVEAVEHAQNAHSRANRGFYDYQLDAVPVE